MKASIPEFLMWWLSYGEKFPGLEPEFVVARIAANPITVDFPEDYFFEICRTMWRALQPTIPPIDPEP
jgi:hypothetical protein